MFSTITGVPRGIFSPSLDVGAGLASTLSQIFPNTPLGALGPIASVVIVSEMSNDHGMAIPLMTAA